MLLCLVLSALWLLPAPCAKGAVLYKSYVVRYDRGRDILCDPYIVQTDDWIYKIFRQKGDISSRDFQAFLQIFKRLNPHVHDLDLVRPGQQILIPLKILEPGSFPGQHQGTVTIPFVTISRIPELIAEHAARYVVQRGDNVSRLISRRFGPFGSKSYQEGLAMFKAINPNILDINFIYTGQEILLPETGIQNQSWYESLFDGTGNIRHDFGRASSLPLFDEQIGVEDTADSESEPLAAIADILDARLLDQGTYFFPKNGTADAADIELNLATHPVLEMKDGTRLVFTPDNAVDHQLAERLSAFWKNVHVIPLKDEAPFAKVMQQAMPAADRERFKNGLSFFDKGVQVTVRAQWIKEETAAEDEGRRYRCLTLIQEPGQRTHAAIVRYLDENGVVVKDILEHAGSGRLEKTPPPEPDHGPSRVISLPPVSGREQFVRQLAAALDCDYAEDVPISFPYAGIQVKAYANLLTCGGGAEILMDFGELYGDSLIEIRKTGLAVVQITNQDTPSDIIEKLLAALEASFEKDPVFTAAERRGPYNTRIKITGYLLDKTGGKILLTGLPLHNRILQFLNARNVAVILTGLAGLPSPAMQAAPSS